MWPEDETREERAAAFSSAQRCFFVSRHNWELFEHQTGEVLTNASVVRNPFKVRYNAQAQWPSADLGWRLACVGTLDPATKGQDLLIRVMAMQKWKERNLSVNCYGSGPCERGLRKLTDALHLRSVCFKGYVEDIEQIWRENHGLIMPSWVEGLPIALVEAMLCHRMALVTDVGGNTELVEHGVNGFVAPAPTVALLDAAMEEAWQRRDEWRELGLEARKKVVACVPPDPVQDFCGKLLETAAGHKQE
jgi:glycosyltransferase involved in cell wall biosynthesis